MAQIILHPSDKNSAFFEYKQRLCLIMYREGGVNTKILIEIFNQLDAMTSYYSRASVVQLQFHLKEETPDNKVISVFLKAFIKELNKKYKSEIGYVWVREQEGAAAQHYHMAVMLSGHLCESSHHVYLIASQVWKKQNKDGFSYRVKNSLYRINRDDDNELNAARYRLSYFAKNKTKNFEKNVHKFGVSQLTFNTQIR